MDARRYSTMDLRVCAVEAVRNGMPLAQTATAFGVDGTTLHRWLARHDRHGEARQTKASQSQPRALPRLRSIHGIVFRKRLTCKT